MDTFLLNEPFNKYAVTIRISNKSDQTLSCKNRLAPIRQWYLTAIMILLLIHSPSVRSVAGIDSSCMRTMRGWDSRENFARVRLNGIPCFLGGQGQIKKQWLSVEEICSVLHNEFDEMLQTLSSVTCF